MGLGQVWTVMWLTQQGCYRGKCVPSLASVLGSRVTLSPLLKQDDSTNPVPTINRHTRSPSWGETLTCSQLLYNTLQSADPVWHHMFGVSCVVVRPLFPPLCAVSTAKNEYVQLLLSYVTSSKPQNHIRLYAYASRTGFVSGDHLANSYFINNEPEELRIIKLENWFLFLNETSKGRRDMVINTNITRQ